MRKFKMLKFASRIGGAVLCILFSSQLPGQQMLFPLAGEYSIGGAMPGDQMNVAVSVNDAGGWLVWQDNATDDSGMGIGARRLNGSFSGEFSGFRVNQIGLGDQENPQVALLSDGGAVFVWQGGETGFQDVFARFVDSSGVFVTMDCLVNTCTNGQQEQPAVAALGNGNVVVVWSSFGQDGHMMGVYGQIFSSDGEKVGGEFQVNQNTLSNQRTPDVAALSGGGFLVTWITERSISVTNVDNPGMTHSFDVMGRLFSDNSSPVGSEFQLSEGNGVCANPSVMPTSDGGFLMVWSRKNLANATNSWDVKVRSFQSDGMPTGDEAMLNLTLRGDQFGPSIAKAGSDVLVLWTSLGQDGSMEGVFGRLCNEAGVPVGGEIQANTTTRGCQLRPAVGAASSGVFLTVWSSFVGGISSYELFAQRFATMVATNIVVAPSAPFVAAVNSSALLVSWPPMAGYPVAQYELTVDGNSSAIVISNAIHVTVTNLLAGITHSFVLKYRLATGELSPPSPVATGTTWGMDNNQDGLPDDWQAAWWGGNPLDWPASHMDSDGDGASNLSELMAGTDPNDPANVLRTRFNRTSLGFVFSWNTLPGYVYQVQKATTLSGWQHLGGPRYAHGAVDFISVPEDGVATFYRVICLR